MESEIKKFSDQMCAEECGQLENNYYKDGFVPALKVLSNLTKSLNSLNEQTRGMTKKKNNFHNVTRLDLNEFDFENHDYHHVDFIDDFSNSDNYNNNGSSGLDYSQSGAYNKDNEYFDQITFQFDGDSVEI